LASVEDIRIVGEAKDFDEALRFTDALRPDVLLVDLNLKGANARVFDLRHLAAACACPVVAMSFAVDAGDHKAAASIGAAHLLDKVRLHDTLLPTLREVAKRKKG
jgi:chemotaxis response regulator CheB